MSLDWKTAGEIASCLAATTVVLGVPVALVQYFRKARQERQQREYSAYNAADDAYVDFLRLCFENPKLDIFDIEDSSPQELSSDEKKQELIAFTMLISVFERAFFVYQSAPGRVVKLQWSGWSAYIRDYCQRQNFRDAWTESGTQFDDEFQRYMTQTIASVSTAESTDTTGGQQSPSTYPEGRADAPSGSAEA